MKNRFAHHVVACLLAVVAHAALAFQPQPGTWWNAVESGRGYLIDVQGNTLFMAIYGYDDAGNGSFFTAAGTLSPSGSIGSIPLYTFKNGQCLSCSYAGSPTGTVIGNVSLVFSSATKGQITFPDGHSIAIERANFGVPNAPQGLLGEWVFAYSIGSTGFGDRFQLSRILSATSKGNGVVVDDVHAAAFEYQVSGTLAGQTIGATFTSTGTPTNIYQFTWTINNGSGFWVSPITFTQYPMDVFRTRTTAGTSIYKSAAVPPQSKTEAAGGIAMSAQEKDDLVAAIARMQNAFLTATTQ